jgi:hypothetical protein
MEQVNTELLIQNILALEHASNQSGGTHGPWMLKPDVKELLISLANNNIKLNPVYIKPKHWNDIIDQSELLI